MLETRNLSKSFGAIHVTRNVSLKLERGERRVILGPNGAGKTTLFNQLVGEITPDKGQVFLAGEDVTALSVQARARRGLSRSYQKNTLFDGLTVEENLQAGAFLRRPGRAALRGALEEIYDWFPRLRDKRATQAGLTSGGEQQMLAIGRALLTRPRLVLLDEPSMGLAPKIVQEIFQIIARLNRDKGIAFLLAEQNATLSLAHARRAYVLDTGRVALEGPAADVAARDDLHRIYLGDAA